MIMVAVMGLWYIAGPVHSNGYLIPPSSLKDPLKKLENPTS